MTWIQNARNDLSNRLSRSLLSQLKGRRAKSHHLRSRSLDLMKAQAIWTCDIWPQNCTNQVATWCRILSMSKTFKDIWWHRARSSGQALWRSLHSAAMESTLLQEVRLPHSVCIMQRMSSHGWLSQCFFIIACFVGAALWQDGVLKLWDMVTGEELMTKAISQMTKDHRWWHDPAPRKFDSIDLMCSNTYSCFVIVHAPCAARNMVRLVCRSMLLDLVAMAPGKMRYHEIIDAIRGGTTNNCIYNIHSIRINSFSYALL